MKKYLYFGALAGLCNGLFGGGGGAILVPFLAKELPTNKALATSLSIMLAITLISLFFYGQKGNLDWQMALPYLLGASVGAMLGGRYFPRLKETWLQRGFAIFLFLAGIRSLLWAG